MSSGGWPFWLFIALLVVLHFLLHLTLGLSHLSPDLLTIAVLLGARGGRPAGGAALGLGLGVLRDSLSVAPFGVDAMILTVLGYVGSRTREFFEGTSLVFVALYLFLGVWVHRTFNALLTGALFDGGLIDRLLVAQPVTALYAMLAGTVLLAVYRALAEER